MKRVTSIILVFVLLLSVLSSCGGNTSNDTSGTGNASKAAITINEEFISLGTSSSGGTFNTLGVAMCQLWTDSIPVSSFTAEVTAGSSENCLRVGMNEIQLAFAASSSVYDSVNGLGSFEGKKVEGIKAIACLYPAIIQIPVLSNSGIENINDIVGKKINIGEAGSGSESTILGILNILEISKNDFNAQQMSHSNAATAVCDEKIDGYMISGSSGQSHQMTAMSSGKCRMIGFTDEQRKLIIEQLPYYYDYVIKADTYPNQNYDVQTIATATLLICNENLSEELVYQITKTIFENLDVLSQSQAIVKSISLENAPNISGVDLHPGAIKYYREKGLMK